MDPVQDGQRQKKYKKVGGNVDAGVAVVDAPRVTVPLLVRDLIPQTGQGDAPCEEGCDDPGVGDGDNDEQHLRCPADAVVGKDPDVQA